MSASTVSRALLSLATLALALACQNGAVQGTPCRRASECASGLVCRFGACRVECTQNRDCPVGTACLLLPDGVGACGLDTDLGCETGVGRVCPEGLVCAVNRCQATCARATDCPSDGACLSLGSGGSFCFDTRSGGDAGLPDVGPADTGTQGPNDAGPADANVDAASPVLTFAVRDVCLGANGGCAIGQDQRVYCWGSNVSGRLGDGGSCTATPASVIAPQVVRTGAVPLENATAIACGDAFACAYASTHIWCWGANDQAQLGRGATSPCESDAQPVQSGGTTLVIPGTPSLSVAGRHGCALDRAASSLWCWGADDSTLDGSGTTVPSAIDVAPRWLTEPAMLAPTQISLAASGACLNGALTGVQCWGDNDRAQCGATPVSATYGPPGWRLTGSWSSLVVGRAHRCALDSSGTAQCWGDDDLVQLGENVFTSDCTTGMCRGMPSGSIAVYYDRLASSGDGDTTCGIVSAGPSLGQVLCWGANDAGQTGAPISATQSWLGATSVTLAATGAPLSGVTRIAVGRTAACAIDGAGVLACWGDTDFDATTAGMHQASIVTITP
jgi:alpha-tubulin suppressor-like RCC1 family protein